MYKFIDDLKVPEFFLLTQILFNSAIVVLKDRSKILFFTLYTNNLPTPRLKSNFSP